jgi:hypothetical protein
VGREENIEMRTNGIMKPRKEKKEREERRD